MKRKKTKYPGVFRLPDGRYEVVIYSKDEERRKKDGRPRDRVKRRRIYATCPEEAAEFRLALMSGRSLGLNALASEKPKRLGEVANEWLTEIVMRRLDEDPTQPYLCPSTRTRYEASVRDFIKPFLGDYGVAELKRSDINEWRTHLLDHGYRRSTINGHHEVLKAILRQTGNDAASSLPLLNPKPDARISRKEPNLLKPKELDRFLEVARERWPQHYALILVLFATTMRISTALALRWEDLDLETMEFVVQRNVAVRAMGRTPRPFLA